MTPDLMEDGARRRAAYAARQQAGTGTESGGRQAAFSRIGVLGVPDFTHGVALYLDDITVSFDGFRALNKLSLQSTWASCAASSAPTAPARPR